MFRQVGRTSRMLSKKHPLYVVARYGWRTLYPSSILTLGTVVQYYMSSTYTALTFQWSDECGADLLVLRMIRLC